MSGGEVDEYTFLCPECGESLSVNASMKAVLVEKGCVICGAPVTEEAFTRASLSDPDSDPERDST